MSSKGRGAKGVGDCLLPADPSWRPTIRRVPTARCGFSLPCALRASPNVAAAADAHGRTYVCGTHLEERHGYDQEDNDEEEDQRRPSGGEEIDREKGAAQKGRDQED